MVIPARLPRRFSMRYIQLGCIARPCSDTHRAPVSRAIPSLSLRYSHRIDIAASPMGSTFPSPLAHDQNGAAVQVDSIEVQLGYFAQAARRVPQHVQHRPVADQAEPVGRGSGEGGIGEHQEIPHLALGHHRDGFLVQAGRLDQMQGVGADIIAFNQPVEEAGGGGTDR